MHVIDGDIGHAEISIHFRWLRQKNDNLCFDYGAVNHAVFLVYNVSTVNCDVFNYLLWLLFGT